MTISDKKITIGSIYGLNNDDEIFFCTLTDTCLRFNNSCTIIGGDWNCTYDVRGVHNNIDTLNMADIPSKRRSKWLQDLCTSLKLSDPYRFFYPERREFTYIPNAIGNNNRSRLDFFLLSDNALTSCVNCTIPQHLNSRLFYHKSVRLSFKPCSASNKQKIKNQILCDEDLDRKIKTQVFEHYIHHAHVCPELPEHVRDLLLFQLGTVNRNLSEINEAKLRMAGGGDGVENLESRALFRNECDLTLNNFPDLAFFESLRLNRNDKIFFETLVMSVKNSSLSHQHSFYKIKNLKKSVLMNELQQLKKDFLANQGLIFQKELELSSIIEHDLCEELKQNKKFENMNNEKITPYFMAPAKLPDTEAVLTDIQQENGTDFLTKKDRDDYIVDYYRQVYNNNDNTDRVHTTIDSFLGNVSTHPDVISSKLNEDEREDLDRPLSIEELDLSIKKAKTNSAPGIDGISNKFIQHFWCFFRVPLYKYAICSYDTGSLTDSFRTAKIRLIPKKGDLTKLKNWRPISLLSCFYKVLSRAISHRLQKYMDKLTKVSQKGFSGSRQCQEVLINIIDAIHKLRATNCRGVLISLDIKKAFDSTSHVYLQKAYSFFNFGPNIIRWLNLIGTNRKACIILENDFTSSIFDLKRGNAQGDNVSPYIFNLCYQILLFKLTYDLQIEGILEPEEVPPTHPPIENEVIQRPYKVFAYADDANALLKLDHSTLLRLRTVLDEFGLLSGLECNVEKTTLLQVGAIAPLADNILELGFSVVNKVCVLGLELTGPGAFFTSSLEKITVKLQQQVNNWSRFNLSLPGRICIAKTMLYSQINYLCSFLPVGNEHLNTYSTIIERFVSRNLNIAKKRFYKPICNGGLGLMDLIPFLDAQRCAWVKRASTIDELWKINLYSRSFGSVFNIRAKYIDKNESPITHAIATSFENFAHHFTRHNENFKKSFIFDCPSFTFGLCDRNYLNRDFFSAAFFRIHSSKIVRLTLSDFLCGNNLDTVKSYVDFTTNSELPINHFLFLRLKGLVNTARVRGFSKNNSLNKTSTDIITFLNRSKRGSSRLRKIMSCDDIPHIPHNRVKFASNTEVIIGLERSKILNSTWNISYLSNSLRTFLFKLRNNTLGFNNAVAHFVRGHSPNCTFCDIVNNPDPEDETPLHLFFSCTVVEQFLVDAFQWLVSDNSFTFSRQEYFTGFQRPDLNGSKNFILTTASNLIIKFIWDSKQRFCIPNLQHLKFSLVSDFETYCSTSKKFKQLYISSGLQIL